MTPEGRTAGACREGSRRSWSPRALLAVVVVWSAVACTVEPRADTGSGGRGDPATAFEAGAEGDSASVLAVVSAFHDALRVGDVARVAALAVPGAMLVDQEEGIRWRVGADDARLPSALDAGRGSGGLDWTVAQRSVRVAGDARVVTLRWQAVIAGEPVEWWGVESLVLVPTEAGWRLTHVHRSRGGDPTPGPARREEQ